MIRIEIRERFLIISGLLKQRWSRVTGDEFQALEGRFEEIAGRVRMQTLADCRRLKTASGK